MQLGRDLDSLLRKFQNDDARQACIRLVVDLALAGHKVQVSISNPKKDVHFIAPDDTKPYALIANNDDLLFYFRKGSKKPRENFDLPVNCSPTGEATVRVCTEANAEEVLRFISSL